MAISKGIKYFFIILIIAVAAVAATGIYLWNKPHIKVEDRKGITLTADQLCKAFNENEAAANTLYLNKAIQVSGRISEVATNLDGGSMIVIQTSDASSAVQCSMREQNVPLQIGEMVVLKGFCSGNTITGVSLTGCIRVQQ
jgi:hypothetical protein